MESIKPEDILSLPPLPISVMKLSKMVTDPSIGLNEYAKIIELDPILTGSVLRWANSTWGATSVKITSINQAVTRLGTDNILQLALGVHMMATMRKILGKTDISENEIWRHSLATAITTKIIRDDLEIDIPTGAFSAAIIHDIGKILIARHLTYDQTQDLIVQATRDNDLTYLEAESEVMKTNHVILGIDIAEHWKLPEELIQVIAYHHDLENSSSMLLTAVQIANGLTKIADISAGTSNKDIDKQMQVINELGLTDSQKNKLLKKMMACFQAELNSN